MVFALGFHWAHRAPDSSYLLRFKFIDQGFQVIVILIFLFIESKSLAYQYYYTFIENINKPFSMNKTKNLFYCVLSVGLLRVC